MKTMPRRTGCAARRRGQAVDADLAAAEERFRTAVGPRIAAMAELAGLTA